MNQSNVAVTPLVLLICYFIAGCELTLPKQTRFLDDRVQLAKQLENQGRLADALLQWKIIHKMYPQNQYVLEQKVQLAEQIARRVSELENLLGDAEQDTMSMADKKTYLKILALAPAHAGARQALQRQEWSRVESAATLKTANIQKLFEENQVRAKREIDLARYQQQVKDLLQSKKYVSLIQVTERFLQVYPDYRPAFEVKYNALVGIANNHLKAGRREQAIAYYERAQSVNDINADSLSVKIRQLREQVSNDFYARGMKVFKTNIDKAVELLQRSLEANPDNYRARQQLTRATKIQKNLQRIKQAS